MSTTQDPPEQAPQPSEDDPKWQEAVAALKAAGILADDADPEVVSLLVAVYLKSGGLPSRIIQPGEGPSALPDLTTSDEGRQVIDDLKSDLAALLGHTPPPPPS
jgi:hypothetical protein